MAEYAEWLMEAKREQRGLLPDDKLQDEDIIKELKSGEKLSKSKHLNQKENHMTDKQIRDEAMRQVMWKCGITANDVTRYIADAVAEKVVRDESGEDWIPVSERLPVDHKTYICTVLRFEDNYIHSAELIYYPTDDTWAWQDDPEIKELSYKTHRITAWMEKPEPYKAE